MKIYVAHSKKFDYLNDLYEPLEKCDKLRKHSFSLPHKNGQESYNNYKFYEQFDYILADVSEQSIGLGIELGWANVLNVPIICMYKKGKKVSKSLTTVSNTFIEYTDSKDMIDKLLVYLV